MELRDLMDLEVPIDGKENQTKDSFTECTVVPVDGEIKLCEKTTNASTEKNVAECEPPELIVCLKEASYNVVKDICIDEGVPTLNKISVEKDVVNHDDKIIRQASSLDVDNDLIKGVVEGTESISDVVKPSVECDAEMDVTGNCPSEMVKRSEGIFNSRDGIVNDACSNKVVTENNILVQELETVNSQPETSNSNSDGGPQQSDQDTSGETDSKNSEEVLLTATEESNHENPTPGSFNGNMDSTTPDTTSRDEDPQSSEAKQLVQLVQPVKTVNPEDTWPSLESRVVSSRMFTHHGYGESSFSVSDPLSSLVTYSGHLPYSGSISLRSDSSTTSTRSFAFPILNSEWTSSPVKMAKADRRHFRKHQRWKLSLLCCRF